MCVCVSSASFILTYFASGVQGTENVLQNSFQPLCQQHPGDKRDSCWHSESTRQVTATKHCLFWGLRSIVMVLGTSEASKISGWDDVVTLKHAVCAGCGSVCRVSAAACNWQTTSLSLYKTKIKQVEGKKSRLGNCSVGSLCSVVKRVSQITDWHF